MRKPENSYYPADWLKVAKKDWERIKRNLRDDDAEAAGFFLQQSLEKYLKAYLLEKGWKLKKVHELDSLLDDAIKYNSNLETFRSLCERVSGYYFTERYPHLVEPGLTCNDIEKDVKEAKEFIQLLFPTD
jgi:HEPN domain-containing protein